MTLLLLALLSVFYPIDFLLNTRQILSYLILAIFFIFYFLKLWGRWFKSKDFFPWIVNALFVISSAIAFIMAYEGMISRYVGIAVPIVVVLLIVIINYNYNFRNITSVHEKDPVNYNIVVSHAPGTDISRKGVTLRYTNNSNITYSYGHYFELQTLILYDWEMVMFTPGVTFALDEFGIQPDSYVDIHHSLQTIFSGLRSGKYRIIREFTPVNDDLCPQNIVVVFEFEL